MIDKHREIPSVALMSGKGGSGKTSITAAMAKIISRYSLRKIHPIVVDADTGTGGMTYYLGLKTVKNKKIGLIDFIKDESKIEYIENYLQKFKCEKDDSDCSPVEFIGLGSHRLIHKHLSQNNDVSVYKKIIEKLEEDEEKMVFVDCRGGVDDEVISIGAAVDDILLVVEPDTTSFQATQHLVDELTDAGLGKKIKGFIINKVFDNPSAVARNGSGVFGGEYLVSVPFDIESMRSFLVGDIPKENTLYCTHIWHALHNAYPNLVEKPKKRQLEFNEYSETSTINPSADMGGFFISFSTLAIGVAALTNILHNDIYQSKESIAFISTILFMALANGSRTVRMMMGNIIKEYIYTLKKIMTK